MNPCLSTSHSATATTTTKKKRSRGIFDNTVLELPMPPFAIPL